ncbi:hypothetical protein [Mangrovitalea sediminis]|uniref:hypothetical protein n=1 Tax=Mangrovitalea sediminis TaxID=1982043 RepID=UPI000BE613AF|nr:hypothetical protein [Mangrovitalea sediminis]
MTVIHRLRLWLGCFSLLGLLITTTNVQAIPAFARQTDLPCTACHNGNFPALNSFGRQFKLSGYVLSAINKVTQTSSATSSSQLSLVGIPPMSAMVQVSSTHNSKSQPNQQNNDVQFPDQLSLFFGGSVTPDIGLFVQLTHSQGDAGFTMDNADVRMAQSTTLGEDHSLTYGVDLNNNPTVEDLWNSTPVWSFPWASSSVAPSATAAPFIESLGQNVAGLGTYGMLDNTYYADVALYRSAFVNGTVGSTNTIDNAAPYWRLAWQHNFDNSYLMIGTYGIYAKVYPQAQATSSGNGIGGPTSRYFDRAVDFQYEMPFAGPNNSLIVHGNYTDEARTDLDGSGNYSQGQDGRWKTGRIDTEFNIDSRWRPAIAWFNTTTGNDNLNNSGFIGEISVFPWENLDLSIQYRDYTKFDGTTTKASDNNSLYLLAWLVI